MQDKQVVVTGGAGFIGSNLAQELARGNRVIIIDDFCTGKEKNVESLIANPNVKLIRGSILDMALLQDALQKADYVFHQAAIPSVPRSIANPLATHEANVTGTLNVLIAARDNRVRKVICASSSSVYGDTPTLPKQESMSPNPQSPYAVTKLTGELYAGVFQRVYGLKTACLRYFNVFGPGQDPDSQYAAVIPRFITAYSQDTPPVIFGDGEQTRDFTFIKDVIQANIRAAESDATGVFNVGSGGNRVSINQLARAIGQILGSEVGPIHQDPRPGDIKDSLADISKAKVEFGYEPAYNMEAGLEETIRSYQNGK